MKRLSIAVASLLLAAAAAATSTNTFKSVTVGFEITKPDAWNFLTAQQNLENLRNTNLSDEEFHQLMLKHSTVPLVAMTKYPEPYEDLNPSLKVTIKPFGQMKGADPKHILAAVSAQLQVVFKDFQLVQPPTDTEVSGITSGYMRINYSVQAPDGRLFPTTSELWIVPRGDYFFLIGAGTRQDGGTGARREIEEILSTVKITS